MDKAMKIVVVTGPTATGKTALAVQLAACFDGEIVSVDSRQVYRSLDIGTGKDLAEYRVEERVIPHHLIDIADPNYTYNLMEFCRDARRAVETIGKAGRLPVLAGGTALYLNAFLSGFSLPGVPADEAKRRQLNSKTVAELDELLSQTSPELFAQLKDHRNRARLLRALEKAQSPDRMPPAPPLQFTPLIIGVYFPRQTVHRRIEARLDARLRAGMVEEIARLHENGVSWERLDFLGLEYRYVAEYLRGKTNFAAMREKLLIKIRQFAKRQDIWFRKMEREGHVIHWLPGGDFDRAKALVETFLAGRPLPAPELQLKDIDYRGGP
ncbi:MAG: tRNA (adenosine(37)-N6)-dimethylallyltransferase MiaA [Victivallaceae bacterium]|nr:tRNA (adenosine(37)-N6)-dimethylallyltransferase MiaA [Victivallaceae bacterium]